MNKSRLSIKARLLASFIAAAAFAVLATVLAIMTFVGSWKVLDSISESWLPKISIAHQVANQSKAIVSSVPKLLTSKLQSQRESASTLVVEQLKILGDLINQMGKAGIEPLDTIIRDKAALVKSLQRLNALVQIRITMTRQREKSLIALRRSYLGLLSSIETDENNPITIEDRTQNEQLKSTAASLYNLLRAGATTEHRTSVRSIIKDFNNAVHDLPKTFVTPLSVITDYGQKENNIFKARFQELNISGKIERMEQLYDQDANRLVYSANALGHIAQIDIDNTSNDTRKRLRESSIILFILAVTCVGGAIFLALHISRNIGRRLEALEKSMATHAAGGAGEIPVGGNDEITKMGNALRTFIDIIRHREDQLNQELGERKRAEEKLKFSEERFRDFAEASADWFWETDHNFSFTYIAGENLHDFGIGDGLQDGIDIGLGHYSDWFDNPDLWHVHKQILKISLPFDNFRFERARCDGSRGYMSLTGRPVFNEKGQFVGYRGTGRDVSESQRLSQQLIHQARHDALTGLVNRREFERRLTSSIEDSQNQDQEHSICYLDLDQFKVVNDTCGHIAGDELLRQLCEILKPRIRKQDTFARLGGDEFGVLLNHCNLTQAGKIAESMRKSISEFRFNWNKKVFKLGVSIGLVPITRDSIDFTTVLSHADSACYAAKERGRNRIHVYEAGDEEMLTTHGQMQWVAKIHQALDEQRFRLFYQPIVPINPERHAGKHYELLLRMISEDGQLVLPGAFLPAAERYHLMELMDRWVLQNALYWFAESYDQLTDIDHLSINLSGHSLTSQHFLDFAIDELEKSGVPAEKICFEITETSAIANMLTASHFIEELRNLGCRFALDDFGSGFSSFGYLKNLPVEYIKIDGVFIKDICDDPLDLAMVKSINEIGHVMGKKTVAEFVENEAILNKLQEIGVDFAQGYLIGKPQALGDAKSLKRAIASR